MAGSDGLRGGDLLRGRATRGEPRQRPPFALVSVLIPAFDAAATLTAALASVARQREERFECIVVDDGSRDETAAIAREFAARDPRFRVLRGAHSGLVAALNRGLVECRAPLVARMDADDVMHRERLAAQCSLLDSRSDLGAVACGVRLFPRGHLQAGFRTYEAWLNGMRDEDQIARDAFIECPVAHPSLTVRRDVLVRHGYRTMGWPEDYDLVLRMLAAGDRIGIVRRRLLSWRDHPTRYTRQAPECAIARFAECKAHFLAHGLLAGTDRYVLWGYGGTGRALRRALAAHAKAPSHIVEVHPGRLGHRIHGAPVIEPGQLREIPRLPLVASVAGAQARGQIRAALATMGYVELRDFVVAA